jgi:hypothetical protein
MEFELVSNSTLQKIPPKFLNPISKINKCANSKEFF